MFAAGFAVPIALLRGGFRGGRRCLVVPMWVGSVILIARGGSGLLDDAVRAGGLSEGGITGLGCQDTLGTAHPSTYTVISTDAIDAYFFLGGVLLARAATSRPRRTERDRAQIV